MSERREVRLMMRVAFTGPEEEPSWEEVPRHWISFDREQWYPASGGCAPTDMMVAPTEPGITLGELQSKVGAEGGTLQYDNSWPVKEKAYVHLAALAALAPEHIQPYPELVDIHVEAERLVLEEMKQYGITDTFEAARVLSEEGMLH